MWCKGATNGLGLEKVGPNSLRLMVSQTVDEAIQAHLRHSDNWGTDDLHWDQVKKQVAEYLGMTRPQLQQRLT
jgi:hypothetical protein